MFRLDKGGLRIFRLLGIDVFVHWSWALFAVVELMQRAAAYGSQVWNILEYLTLFLIVLMHEFGHALACRSVGGKANRIMLWPLGGLAYVDPPPRPGATLWSIAAGPLVNLVLACALAPILLRGLFISLPSASDNVARFLFVVSVMNGAMLLYNLLPLYPLDGGQILHSILWYFLGRARALMAATVVGMAGAAAIFVFAVVSRNQWFIYLALFNAYRCYTGFQAARAMHKLFVAPRHDGLRCPACRSSPPRGAFWKCSCGAELDVFAAPDCPRCHAEVSHVACPECRASSAVSGWHAPAAVAVPA